MICLAIFLYEIIHVDIFLSFYLSIKWFFHTNLNLNLFFLCFPYRLIVIYGLMSSWCEVYLCVDDSNNKTNLIKYT